MSETAATAIGFAVGDSEDVSWDPAGYSASHLHQRRQNLRVLPAPLTVHVLRGPKGLDSIAPEWLRVLESVNHDYVYLADCPIDPSVEPGALLNEVTRALRVQPEVARDVIKLNRIPVGSMVLDGLGQVRRGYDRAVTRSARPALTAIDRSNRPCRRSPAHANATCAAFGAGARRPGGSNPRHSASRPTCTRR